MEARAKLAEVLLRGDGLGKTFRPVQARLSPAEIEAVDAAAARVGLTRSAWLRHAANLVLGWEMGEREKGSGRA